MIDSIRIIKLAIKYRPMFYSSSVFSRVRLILILSLLTPFKPVHSQHLELNTANKKQVILSQVRNAGKDDCAYKNLTTAYESIGYSLEFLILPAKRALMESNAGRTDGETARIYGIERAYPNLVRIPVAICHMKQSLYTLKSQKNLVKNNNLNNLKLGILNGGVFVETEFNQYNPTKALNEQQLLNLLLKQRVDVIIMSPNNFKQAANANQASKIMNLKSMSANIPLYHYLHKKHQDLIPKITQSLQQLEASGFVADAIKNHRP